MVKSSLDLRKRSKMAVTEKKIRCAIYTRKSSEEGLELDFNSLDAQREACEAYIKSQQHEGWTLIDKQYNDGGFSGGTLERPALKELFEDIADGKIDTVVVYKIDRLTRSLMDFSKIVELFDKKSTTFVSITQQFNTTTSMGRLTLNILLSFAQFEREVTGERIRDKIAATKKKGIWAGGAVAMGYELKDKKIVIDDVNAKTIRLIFDKYLELKSVNALSCFLRENDIKTTKGVNFSKGGLYHILQNVVYAGKIKHKNNVYEGEHKEIIDKETFDKVQSLLLENRVNNKYSNDSKNPSLLAGKLFDDNGNYMTPSHSQTRKKHYRYYVSQAILQFRKNEAGSISKIPAGEVETFVTNELSQFVFNKKNIHKYIEELDIGRQREILNAVKNFSEKSQGKLPPNMIRTLIDKITLYKTNAEITICKDQLIKVLKSVAYDTNIPEELKNMTNNPILLSIPIQIIQTPRKGSIVIISDSRENKYNINPQLVKAITRSHLWNNLLLTGKVKSTKELQEIERFTDPSYISEILKLKFLAPDITESILNGTQPIDLNIKKLRKINSLDWDKQRKLINA